MKRIPTVFDGRNKMASTFTTIPLPVVPQPDPHKYVNYTLGMLLGVDDFTQEHAYLSGYDHWLTRELIGYGTASGLHVTSDVDGERGPRVLVDRGVAVSPRGQLIRATPDQCAYINDWLAANRQQLGDTPDNPLTLYVVLSYRACATDTVPISGEPCRSEDSLMAPSRLSDDFTLELRLAPPDQREEEALRAFIAWLRQVRVGDAQTTHKDKFTTPENFAQAIRKAAHSSDPASPTALMTGSPPTQLLIPADKACEYWQIAFVIWTTELRPHWRALCSNGDVPDEESLLLAKLWMPISKSPTTGGWQVKPHKTTNPVLVDEGDRPRLLHLQLLQEWMLCGRHETPPSDFVSEATSFGQKPDPGKMTSYSRGDHSHGTPENILYSLSVILSGYSRADHSHGTPELRGDAVNTRDGSVTVQVLQHTAIDPTHPVGGQVLMYSDEYDRWQPSPLPEPPAMVERPRELGRYTIVAAGWVRCDGTGPVPSYNGLNAKVYQDRPVRVSAVRVSFNEYSNARLNQYPYIVKVLAKPHDPVKPCIVHFDRFLKNFFVLRVTDGNGNSVSRDYLEQLELMIEVSQYEVLAS
jgi:hypothetical protein